jgi:large subunit ribosomal protein L9
MKVILTEDVDKLGDLHEIVEVADGYARNFLLPRSLATPATKSALANLDNVKRVGERRQARLKIAAEAVAAQLADKTVVVEARIGSGGRLYGSIGNADIAEQVQKSFGVEIDKKTILLAEPIRQTGLYRVPVKLHRDVQIKLPVQIGDTPEGGWPEEQAAPVEAETAEATA